MQSQQQTSGVSPDTSPTEPRLPFNEISILFPLLTLYTVSYMGLMAAEFILRGAFVIPAGMMPVYIALVGAYAADKEIRRWAIGDQPSRKGALFVYIWMIFFLAAFLLQSFRVDFTMPGEFSKVVLQVLGIFFGSRASKYIYANRQAEDRRQTTDDGQRTTDDRRQTTDNGHQMMRGGKQKASDRGRLSRQSIAYGLQPALMP